MRIALYFPHYNTKFVIECSRRSCVAAGFFIILMPCNLPAGVYLLSAAVAAAVTAAASVAGRVFSLAASFCLSEDSYRQQYKGRGCDDPNQNLLYFFSYHIRFPILYVKKAIIQATHVLYTMEKRAYFQLPASCAMVAMVPMHGK